MATEVAASTRVPADGHAPPWAALLTIAEVPARLRKLASAASVGAIALGLFVGYPAWLLVLSALLPWVPLFVGRMAWTHRHYGWLALFAVLTVTQLGHVLEHVAQIVQIHVLGRSGLHARGVFGALDVEWVHLAWNSWIIVAVFALLRPFRGNRWLWVTLVFAGWHEAEHLWIISDYLKTGVAGTPGLLAKGGAIGGGLSLPRPDLHFLYNLIETTPMVLGFAWQLRRSYDEWLARAFPQLAPDLLVDVSREATSMEVCAGRRLPLHSLDAPRPSGRRRKVRAHGDAVYVIIRGEVDVVTRGPSDEVVTLGPGSYFRPVDHLIGSDPPRVAAWASTDVELLALEGEAARRALESRHEVVASAAVAPKPAAEVAAEPVPAVADPVTAEFVPSAGVSSGDLWSGFGATESVQGPSLLGDPAAAGSHRDLRFPTALMAVGTATLLGTFSALGLRRRRSTSAGSSS